MIRPIHPFPARMAPEIALVQLERAKRGSVVLDPMAGSGTVLRHAIHLGHQAIGVDMDPLAVLMARVWTSRLETDRFVRGAQELVESVKALKNKEVELPWIDEDPETSNFIDYWFGEEQRTILRRFAFLLNRMKRTDQTLVNAYRIALSRVIITKDRGASLARDVSHSRPHKSWDESDYDVIRGFELSVNRIAPLLEKDPAEGSATVHSGDARKISAVASQSVDVVLTSPPYLNAIDYMRGHRMSLVWFGHRLASLRTIRSDSIGAERAPNQARDDGAHTRVRLAMCARDSLSGAESKMVDRYAGDLLGMTAEIFRVLKPKGTATLVVGNSCLKGTFVKNSDGVSAAAKENGLQLVSEDIRELPQKHRYLPTPKQQDAPLGKRMKTESIITFRRKG